MGYSDSKYGFTRRVIFPNVDAIGTAGIHPDEISFATKTKITNFGIIGQDNTVRASSDTVLALYNNTDSATVMTWTQSTATKGSTLVAADTVKSLSTTPTVVDAGDVLQGDVEVIGSTGNFQYFIDVQEQFDATS